MRRRVRDRKAVAPSPTARRYSSRMPGNRAPLAAVALALAASFASAGNEVPQFDHVVIVIEENHAYPQVIGSASAPYINSLAAGGALMTQSFAVAHPSQPNYIALFSGSTQ